MTSRVRLSIVLMLTLSMGVVASAKTIVVDCSKKSINTALLDTSPDLIVEFTGACAEDVLIQRDGVTLRGVGAAVIDGAPGVAPADKKAGVTVLGADNVVLENFTINDSDSRGIDARGTSRLVVRNVTASGNGDGMILLERASAFVIDSHFDGNNGDGVGAWDNSTVVFEGACTMNGNTRVGILASGGSSLSYSTRGGSLAVDGNLLGINLQLGATAQLSSPSPFSTNVSNSFVGVAVYLGSSWSSRVTVSDSDYCVDVENASIFSGRGFLSNCFVAGLYADAATVELPNTSITGSGDTDVYLDFGARLTAFGSSAGSVSCGDGVMTRGGISCPSSAVAPSILSMPRRIERSKREPLPILE